MPTQTPAPRYELLRHRLADGEQTTVYLVRYPRPYTRVAIEHFPARSDSTTGAGARASGRRSSAASSCARTGRRWASSGSAAGAVRRRVRASDWDLCVVLDSNGVVIGRIGRAAIAADDDRSVEAAMSEGPGTIRPDTPLERIVARLRERNLTSVVVTTSDGRLVGVLRRGEAEAALADPESRTGEDASEER